MCKVNTPQPQTRNRNRFLLPSANRQFRHQPSPTKSTREPSLECPALLSLPRAFVPLDVAGHLVQVEGGETGGALHRLLAIRRCRTGLRALCFALRLGHASLAPSVAVSTARDTGCQVTISRHWRRRPLRVPVADAGLRLARALSLKQRGDRGLNHSRRRIAATAAAGIQRRKAANANVEHHQLKGLLGGRSRGIQETRDKVSVCVSGDINPSPLF